MIQNADKQHLLIIRFPDLYCNDLTGTGNLQSRPLRLFVVTNNIHVSQYKMYTGIHCNGIPLLYTDFIIPIEKHRFSFPGKGLISLTFIRTRSKLLCLGNNENL